MSPLLDGGRKADVSRRGDLRQRPDEDLVRTAPRASSMPASMRGQSPARRRIRARSRRNNPARRADSRGAASRQRRRPAPALAPAGEPVVILELQPVERRRRPADRQVGAQHLGPAGGEHGRQIDEDQQLGVAARRGAHCADEAPRSRRRAARPQHRAAVRAASSGCAHARRSASDSAAERRARRGVVQAERPSARTHHHGSPTWKRTGTAAAPSASRTSRATVLQIAHRRRRSPATAASRAAYQPVSAGDPSQAALLPVVPAMLVEQFVGQRQDQREPQRGARARRNRDATLRAATLSTPPARLTR